MSLDDKTRNVLSNIIDRCRRKLTDDVTYQLQETFGLYPDGGMLPLEEMTQLSSGDAAAARTLRDLLGHYSVLAAGDPKERRITAFGRLVLEISFTALNRLAAIRLCEERGLVVECIRKGTASDGFRIYERIAGGALGSRHGTYRMFLECTFDELAVDLGVLFDRTTPTSIIFPSETCLNEVLDLLNAENISPLWKEDETIGWIYQYFNPPEERRAMRDASEVPRNSRELAVRNQFFTPRYVVEFLTDNTLGRIWYEMQGGATRLVEDCRYLVRRPNEMFLRTGETAPETEEMNGELSQEELLQLPVYIEHRPKKDPRDITVLDPACGSGHFLLYAFDLLETIYLEAWEDPDSPPSEATGTTLRDDYSSLEDLQRRIPELIIRWNLHGIDIDPRAVQIAALALWLRAQRAWQAQRLAPAERPRIRKSNIVCAEPMPGEIDLLREFTATLQPKVLGQIVEVVFGEMKFAGEAGSLLKIEEKIHDAIAEAKKQWLSGPHAEQATLFPTDVPKQTSLRRFSIKDIPDEEFWDQAEVRILAALREYAECSENSHAVQRRLFAEDAARGFAFIDTCRKRFEIVLMNPPFGAPSSKVTPSLPTGASGNLYAAFALRAIQFGATHIGCISDRTFTIQASFEKLRGRLIESSPSLNKLVDLGWDILDADVQVAIYTLTDAKDKAAYCLDVRDVQDKEEYLSNFGKVCRIVPYQVFLRLPNLIFAYSLPKPILDIVEHSRSLADLAILPRGLGSNKAERTYLFWAEVPSENLQNGHRWEPLANGGGFYPYYRQDLGVADWRMPSGNLWVSMSSANSWRLYDQASTESYFLPGLSFPKQSSSFNVALLPFGYLPTREGKAILPNDLNDSWYLLALLNSGPVRAFIRDTCGLHKQSGAIGRIPIPNISDQNVEILRKEALKVWRIVFTSYIHDETSRWFVVPEALSIEGNRVDAKKEQIDQHLCNIEFIARSAYHLESDSPWSEPPAAPVIYKPHIADVVSWIIGVIFGRFDIRNASTHLPQTYDIDPFCKPNICSPGMLVGSDSLPAKSGGIVSEEWLKARPDAITLPPEGSVERLTISDDEYPIRISWDGILVDDPGIDGFSPHRDDVVSRVQEVIDSLWSDRAAEIEQEISEILDVSDLRDYFRSPSGFFDNHLTRYSKSRRKAPIYWLLSTASGSYALWLYYHRLTDQTIYVALNKYLEPKIAEVERNLARIETELAAATGRAARELRDRAVTNRTFLGELRDLREELIRIAELPYRPDLNDGVIINAAPFHKLFRHGRWAEATEETWRKLEKGDYDWAHMAYAMWPDRVRTVCRKDRSIAIAHSLEVLCEVEEKTAAKKRGGRRKRKEATL